LTNSGAGDHTIPDLAELFGVSRATVYRVLDRAQAGKRRHQRQHVRRRHLGVASGGERRV